jgi:glycyl-tRNA synthetase beta chain
MSVLLLEIGCEELPAAVCRSVIVQVQGDPGTPGLMYRLLADERLLPAGDGGDAALTPASFADRLRVLVSPRRIAVLVEGVPGRQQARVQEFRGPKADIAFADDGSLTKAGLGFARARGAEPGDVRRGIVNGAEFAVVSVESERRDTVQVAAGLVARLVTGLQIPRGMRWGRRPPGEDDYLRFSRPIRWLVGKYGTHTLEGSFYGLPIGDVTQGHRVLGAPVAVVDASSYEEVLAAQHVLASQDERRRLILESLQAAADELGGSWSDPGDVLAEAVYLAEWPSVARGSFDARHLRLPAPVLITAMQSHQRYFPVQDREGAMLPSFLYVSNGAPEAAPLVTKGNERVLEGRLDDAEFAYDRDLAEGLEAMAARLDEVVFHKRLGSLADKARRLQGIVAGLAAGPAAVGGSAGGNGSGATDELATAVRTAARLCKADLVSQVVIEFPSLQGEMGGIYARHAGLGEPVAAAVGEHYRPLSATAPLPSTVPGSLLAVADKADGIVGAWVAGEKPSGSRDPYGLRRAAMGIVRIALGYSLRFPLDALLAAALDQYELQGTAELDEPARDALVAETAAFVRERLQVLLLDDGLPFASVEAALAADCADLPGLAARARGIAALAGRDFFEDAVTAYNRCASLAAKDPAAGSRAVDPALFTDPAEGELFAALEEARQHLAAELAHLEIESAVKVAAALRPPVDRFFDDVLVMDKDAAVRDNRLALLAAVTAAVRQIGEFSRLPLTQA